jgi:DNA-binding NtrC family response regulator
MAHGGTLFLDEIGELPLDLQPKLLRALEQRAFRRVGGNKEIRVDIRVIAASKRNLKMEVARGKFREDLYFRLAVVPIEMPALRERRDDIPLLATRILEDLSKNEGQGPLPLAKEALEALSAHDWPGNVRELRNVLERASYLARAQGLAVIPGGALPMAAAPPSASPLVPQGFDATKSYRDTRAEWEASFEKAYVSWLLERHHGNISAASRAADMDRKYLHKLAKKHGVRGEGDEES